MAQEASQRSAYPTLPTDEPSIRLATIEASKNGNQFAVTTWIQPLGSFPQNYTALSYTGIIVHDGIAQRDSSAILLNKQKVWISSELMKFLQRLDELEKYGPFWCDSLCINQDDLTEKTNQVAMMTEIFFNASTVWGWLGDESHRSEIALGILTKYCSDNNSEPSHEKLHPYIQDFGMTIEEFMATLGHLFNRTYWSRVWIVQEVCFGSAVVLFCGTYWISWIDLQQFASYLANHENPMSELPSSAMTSQSTSFAKIVLDLKISRKALRNGTRPGGFLLVELVDYLKNFNSTDPRDKLFALHAMSHEFYQKSAAFMPDYTKSPESLFWSCICETDCPCDLLLVAGSGLLQALGIGTQFHGENNLEEYCSYTAKRFLLGLYHHDQSNIGEDSYSFQRTDCNVIAYENTSDRRDRFRLFSILGVRHEFKQSRFAQGWQPYEILHTGIILWLDGPHNLSTSAPRDDNDFGADSFGTVVAADLVATTLSEQIQRQSSDCMPPLPNLIGAKVYHYVYSNPTWSLIPKRRSRCDLSAIQYGELLFFYRWIWRNMQERGYSEPLMVSFETYELTE